jgi:hypothetical protein
MVDSIKITALQDIGANIAYTTLVPLVNMAGTPTTQKANLQNLGNLILNGAGGSYFARAAQSNLALSVANAAQPNITSVGNLTSLTVTGNITAANVNGGNLIVANFFSGDGGFLTNVASGSNYSNSNVANYLPTYTGNVGAGNVNTTGTVYTSGISSTGLSSLTILNVSTTANLGAVGNVRITGGSAGQKLTTDGAGNLTWTNDANSSYGNSNVVSLMAAFGSNTITTTGNVSIGNANITGLTSLAALTVSTTANLGAVGDITITGGSNGQVLTTNGNGEVSWTTVAGGVSSELVNGNNSFVLNSSGNVVFEGNVAGQAVDRGLVWDYGANANGVNSTIRQDNGGLTVRAWTENGGGANGYSAPVTIVTNQDPATKAWVFDAQGNLTVPTGSINSINDGGDLGAYIALTPDLGLAKLAARDAQSNVNYTNTSWSTATYTGTQVDFTNAPDLVAFFNTNSFNDGINQTFSINGDEPVPFTGYSIGVSNAVTVYTSVSEPDPTTVTSINFSSQFESYVSVDYDGGELNIAATGLTILIDNDQTEGPDIVLRSGDDISLQAKDMSVGSEREGGDINLNAGDGSDDDGLGNIASSGGDIIIDAGRGGDGNSSSGSSGGFTQIRGGIGGTAGVANLAGGGGYIEIAGGSGGFNNSNTALGASGGDVNIYGGDTTREAFNGADVNLTSGAGGANAFAGSVNISTPASDSGPGGLWQFDGAGLLTLPDGAIIDTIGNNFEVRAVENVNFEANAVVNIYTDGSGNAYQWQFGDDGNLTLPGNTFAVNYANGSPVVISGGSGNTGNVTFDDNIVIGTGDEYGGAGLYLATGPNGVANVQYLRVRGGDAPTHIHLDTGNNQAYDQYFGDDAKYVKLELGDAGNVVVGTDDATGNSYRWSFTSDGNFILANGNSVIQSIANSSLDPLNPNVSTMVLTPDPGYSTQALVLDPTAPGHIHLRAPGANIDEPGANIFLGGEDSSFEVGYYNAAAPNLFIHSNNNTWTFDNAGNLTFPRDAAGNTDPILTIVGGATPTIQSTDASLAGPANLAIQSDYLNMSGYSGAKVVVYADSGEILTDANMVLTTNLANTGNASSWIFDTTGNLTVPNVSGGLIKTAANASIGIAAMDDGTNNPAQLLSMNVGTGAATSIVSAYATNATIQTNAAGTINTWAFDSAGNLTLPANTFAINYANGTQVSLGGGNISNISNGNSNVNIATANGNVTIAAVGNTTMTITGTGANITGTANISGNLVAGNLMGPLANGNSAVTIATAAGNVVANVNGSTVFTAYSGGIKVGGSGILQSPGGAGAITLNNNGANIPTANITNQLNVTGASGANITANLTAGNISTGGALAVTGNAAVTGTLTSTGKIGYASGSTVTQITSRGTSVTINALAGTIVTTSAAMVATEIDTFSVLNSSVDPNNDIVLAQIVSPNQGTYDCIANPAVIGGFSNGFYINIVNISGFTTANETITVRFMVIKAPNA